MKSNYVYLPVSLSGELASALLKTSRLRGKPINFVVTDILKDYLEENPVEDASDIKKIQNSNKSNLNLRVEIGRKIAFLRQANCLSQKDLSALLGLDRKTISNIELGNRRIDVLELVAFSRLFQVDLVYLIEG